MALRTKLRVDDARQSLKLEEGTLQFGAAKFRLGGEAGLPTEQRKDVTLDLRFESDPIDLKKFSKTLVEPIPAAGELRVKGSVTGTAFAPALNLVLDSPSLSVSGKNLSNFHAEISKKEKPLQIQTASFGIYGGSVSIAGQALPGPTTSANLNISLKSLSLAAMSGKPGSPARLSGNLKLASPNVQNTASFSGGGKITVGPFPLPVVNLQNKVKVAEILAAGTALGKMVNVGMLSSSANVIGTQVDAINATVRIAGNTITLSPFSLGNGHFSASGSGTIHQQKTITAGGTFNLKPAVTAQLIPHAMLRQVMTKGSGILSVPFSLSGPLSDPNVSVDSGYLKSLAAKATAMGLTELLAGGVRPADMLNSALKNAPLGKVPGPLGQILGLGQPAPQSQPVSSTSGTKTTSRQTSTRQTSTQGTTTTQKKKSASPLEQILFGR